MKINAKITTDTITFGVAKATEKNYVVETDSGRDRTKVAKLTFVLAAFYDQQQY